MYVAINLVGGALFVVGLALVYALVGTLNMADLAERTAAARRRRAPRCVTAVSMVLLRRLRAQGGDVPGLLLAAGLVSDRARRA